jgi:hypothetical protein
VATRVDHRPLAEVTAELRISVGAASKRRQRAEHRLAAVLHQPTRTRRAAATDEPWSDP